MIYTPLTNRAMQLAYEAHAGQTDKSGVPYIFHPYHLAEQMSDEIAVCVALLHDVLEDTPVTVRELEREFPPAVTEAVRLLTYDREMDYFDYIRSLAVCPVARQVKLADLRHNQDQTRLKGCMQVSEEQREKWRIKYQRALEVLLSLDGSAGKN